MNIHFVCRGNVLRSIIAEAYLRSLGLPDVEVSSSGTNVDLTSPTERAFFADTMRLLDRHDIKRFAKETSHQLTQATLTGQDRVIFMNRRVADEASTLVTPSEKYEIWDIVDIGEGDRQNLEDTRDYEEDIFDEITNRVDSFVHSSLLK